MIVLPGLLIALGLAGALLYQGGQETERFDGSPADEIESVSAPDGQEPVGSTDSALVATVPSDRLTENSVDLAQNVGSTDLPNPSLTVPALVAKQEHPQVASAKEAATDPTKLDRVSALAAGQPFDHELWRDENQRADYLASYVSTVGPQRIFDTKTPGEGVRGIRSVGDTEFDVPVEGVITLSVRTDPGAPVNLLSDGLGVFHETGLTAFTTLADETGLASVEWRAVTGTIGDVVVVAGSPTRSGNVRFFITVHDHQTPERSGAVE